MAFAMGVKKIECNNCGYTGKIRIKDSDLGMWLFLLFTIFVSFFFIPVFIVAGFMLFWLICKPDERICPECREST